MKPAPSVLARLNSMTAEQVGIAGQEEKWYRGGRYRERVGKDQRRWRAVRDVVVEDEEQGEVQRRNVPFPERPWAYAEMYSHALG